MFDLAEEKSYPSPFNDSVLFPLLLMSLAVQKHTPKTKRNFKSKYDYIIVGSGAAGSVVASRLSEISSVNVLLLEAGKSPPLLTELPDYDPTFTDLDWNYKIVPQKSAPPGSLVNISMMHAGKCIGGSSSINGMMYVRGNAEDYNDWKKEGNQGWGYRDVLPYFKKMEHNFAHPSDRGYHGNRGPVTVENTRFKPWLQYALLEGAAQLGYRNYVDYNGRSQNGIYPIIANTRHGQRCGTAKAYLVPAENRTNLDIIERALVTKILIKRKRAVGVEVEHNGTRHIVRARREVILSAGGINSAQLLMLSGIGPANHLRSLGIPVVVDLHVGDNFKSHYGGVVYYQVNFKSPAGFERRNDSNAILDYIYARKGVLSYFYPLMALLNNGKFLPRARPDHEIIFVDEGYPVFSNRRGDIPSFNEYLEQFQNTSFISCYAFNTLTKGSGTIRLNSKDPHDPPLIDPNYYGDPRDLKDVVEGMKHCKELFESEPLKRVGAKPLHPVHPTCVEFQNDDDEFFACMAKAFPVQCYHYTSTAKMGPDGDSEAVLTKELRVRGVKGLRVVDGSAMPTITSGNTHVPIIMVAEKASDMIKKSIFK